MELRPYQQQAKDAIFSEWENGIKKTLLVLPTGCGKTIVFAKVAEECVKGGSRVLILAHRGELLDQAADKIGKRNRKSRADMSGELVPDCGRIRAEHDAGEKIEPVSK